MAYQALLQAGRTAYVTLETVHSAQRRDPHIAASICMPLTTLTKGYYLRRWARRLRDFGFGREDSVILAYGSFGIDFQRQTFGAEVILSADQPLRAGGAAIAASKQRLPVEAGGGSSGAKKWRYCWRTYFNAQSRRFCIGFPKLL